MTSTLSAARGILFDLDGVLTPTTTVHMQAWRRLFTDYLERRGGEPYTDADYFAHIDGKPRYDGVRSLLASRNMVLPEGTPGDDASIETVCGLGNRKDAEFNAVIDADGVTPFEGSVAFLDRAIAAGIAVGVVTSSRNGQRVLAAAGLADRCPMLVDGIVAAQHGLPGKPAPDTYLHGASLLGLTPADCVVVEDAISGVAAGVAGGFGLVLGVDRGAGIDALSQAGAGLVVADLGDCIDSLPKPE